MHLKEARQKLLDEAKSSPNLLSDLAGLESYIAESYHNRSFIELLQNADDAESTKFKIIKSDNLLFVANNGRTFKQRDFESLCRSASSTKVRGETIGYRGIGFKSVVGFAKEIHIISGDLEVTFSKDRTKLEIPEATRVPLIRIPHELQSQDKEKFKPILDKLRSTGYSTIFIFTGVTAQEIELEFDSFDSRSLIFLRNILEIEIYTSETIKTTISKQQINGSDVRLTLINKGVTSEWILSISKNSSIAFSIKEDKVQKLEESDSLVYAFLPTEDKCGIGILINGDFSTDPSRRHIIFDNGTLRTLNSCSDHLLEILEKNFKDKESSNINIVNALIPFTDPRMLQFKKGSFDKFLIETLKNNSSEFFKELKLRPSWLNSKDYSNLIKLRNTLQIDSQHFELNGFISFAKFLGAKEDTFETLKEEINLAIISTLGCVQLSLQTFKTIISSSGPVEQSLTNLKVLLSNSKRTSLDEIKNEENIIDESFITLLIENGLTEFDVKQVLRKCISVQYSDNFFTKKPEESKVTTNAKPPISVIDWFKKPQENSTMPAKASAKRWRSAEEQALEILNQNGFRLEDVSKQNIGYDLGGYDPDGNEIQIEVKSITLPGQKFKLTNIGLTQSKYIS